MDRLELIGSIEYPEYLSTLYKFFDENNALYNIVHPYEDYVEKITGEVIDDSIHFHVKLNCDIANKINKHIDGLSIDVCDTKYFITAIEEKSNKIEIIISRDNL